MHASFQKEEEKKDGEGGKEGREEKSEAGEGSTNGPSTSPRESASPSRYRGPHGRGGGGEQEGLEEGGEVLHRGEMLGELPALGRPSGTFSETTKKTTVIKQTYEP